MKRRLITILTILLCTLMAQAQMSKVNVTIDGPGVVDEYYILSADGKKQMKLKAVPSKFLGNVTFDGWSGDASGTSEELTVDAEKAQNIHATFTYHRPVKKYPLLNLKQSFTDMGKPKYYEMPSLWETQSVVPWRGHNFLPVDYNRDGYLDYVEFPMKGSMGTDNHRENVRFWLGKPDGSFDEDPLNDNRILGTVFSVHLKYADLNDDGYPDFCSFSAGYDRDGSTNDYAVILMSSPEGVYKDLRFEDWGNGCFHGGEVGDIDNDGDIDVVFLDVSIEWPDDKSLLLINDGKGNFTRKHLSDIIDFSEFLKRYPSPDQRNLHGDLNIIDLNNDGYNDLCFTGSDTFDSDGSNYMCSPMIWWGNSSGVFGGTNYSILPQCRLGYSICEDMAFYDLNGDGNKEIIALRCGDGQLGGTRFYVSAYLQVCEWENGQYVDKTEYYIPNENQTFNRETSETCIWIENIDGTDYLLGSGVGEGINYYPGLGVGLFKPYAIRNGILESLESELKTRITSYDEGLPVYVDGPPLTDLRLSGDGVNPIDTMAEHKWVSISDWDATTGNMWRINLAHRKDTHFGRTCIRWNRDGQDPNKELEGQEICFGFVSEVDFQKLADEGYFLEFYIKNTDPDLTLILGLVSNETSQEHYVTISSRHVEGGKFTGEWQRVIYPLSGLNGNGDLKATAIVIKAGKGDLNNEFFLDDIRIRRLYESAFDDYDRAFMKGYLEDSYMAKERTAQVNSQEFKAMLKPLIRTFAPDSMTYFNSYITDHDMPLTRGMATIMAYYVARCIGAETNNGGISGDLPLDLWDCDLNSDCDLLLPHWNDPGEEDYPEDMPWRSTGYGSLQTPLWWNFLHVSDYSGKQVIALDKKANVFHWNNPLTWEDAISAVTRLYDSTDREPVVVLGDANGDGVMNVTDIVATVNYIMEKPSDGFNKEAADLNGDGLVNVTDIVKMVSIIMAGNN